MIHKSIVSGTMRRAKKAKSARLARAIKIKCARETTAQSKSNHYNGICHKMTKRITTKIPKTQKI